MNTAGNQVRSGGSGNTAGITAGGGGLRKTEGDTLTLNAASDYTGATDVEGGTLAFTQPLGGTTAINVRNNATVNAGSDGNDVTLSVVPEPGALGVIGVATAGLLARRRRRRA